MARDLVMVNGLPGSGKSTLGPPLAEALGAAFLSKDRIKEALWAAAGDVPGIGAVAMETAYALAAALTGTVVLESWWFRPRDLEFARRGLTRTGAAAAVEVWCSVPAALALERFVARRRSGRYQDAERLARDWEHWAAAAEPLGLGPVIRAGTSRPVPIDPLAAQVRAALADRSGTEKPGPVADA